MKISQISLTAENLSVSQSCILSCGLSKQMWSLRNLKRFDIIAPKTKWLSLENSLSVIWRFTPSIPLKYINRNNASISTLFVFWPMCTCFIHWSYHSKRALVSVILVFVQSIILSMTSLSKNKWKISSMFLILLALEFGFRQLILPKMVSHFYCLPVATGCSEFHQILFVFFVFL